MAREPDEGMLDRSAARQDEQMWTAVSANGGIATAHYLATRVGGRVLAAGGNAVDAAVAASLALTVCESAGSGIGGMAMMMVHLAESGRTFTIEGPCRAPTLATPEAVAASQRYRGYRAIAVPGYLAAIEHAIDRYGTRPFAELCAGAIELAEEGFAVTAVQRHVTERYLDELALRSGGALFLGRGGAPPAVGTRHRQPGLARTLQRLVRAGVRDFFEGGIARALAADIEAGGGFVRVADLRGVVAREAAPLEAPYRDGVAKVLGPPGGGLSLAQLLHVLRALPAWPDLRSASGVVDVAKLIRGVRRERRRLRLATEAEAPGAAAATLSRAWAEGMIAREYPDLGGLRSGETSHLSAIDRHGNAVSLTQSLERSFGSGEADPELGFLYNGYLRAFKLRSRRHPHYLRPGAAARSNAAPTLVLRGGRPWIAIGSTGSERMVSSIFCTLLRLHDSTPFAAVAGPRLHATPVGEVLSETGRFPAGCRELLGREGFAVRTLDDYSFLTGGLQLVVCEQGRCTAVADPRRDGTAGGG